MAAGRRTDGIGIISTYPCARNDNAWSRRLFFALLRRYGIKPYRYRRQRRTTVMARVSQSFVYETLCPEFEELKRALQAHLDEVTDRVIRESLYPEDAEAEMRQDPAELKGAP